MKITVQRHESVGGATVGKLRINGLVVCHTLEDEVREIEGVPVAQWKIKGKTAIPAGTYKVTLVNSARFGPDTPTINDVPGFQFIRMHAGNMSADTEGCLLLGMQATETTLVGGTSRPAVSMVKQAIKAAITRGEEVTIEISNAKAYA